LPSWCPVKWKTFGVKSPEKHRKTWENNTSLSSLYLTHCPWLLYFIIWAVFTTFLRYQLIACMSKLPIQVQIFITGWKLSTVCSHVHGLEYVCSFSFSKFKLSALLRRTEFKPAYSLLMKTKGMLTPSTSMGTCSRALFSSAPFTTWWLRSLSCNWILISIALRSLDWFWI